MLKISKSSEFLSDKIEGNETSQSSWPRQAELKLCEMDAYNTAMKLRKGHSARHRYNLNRDGQIRIV